MLKSSQKKWFLYALAMHLLLCSLLKAETEEIVNFYLTQTVSACTQEKFVLLPPFLKESLEEIHTYPFFNASLCQYETLRPYFFSFLEKGFVLYPRLLRRTYFFSGFFLHISYEKKKNHFEVSPPYLSFPDPLAFISFCTLEKSPLFARFSFIKKKKLHKTLKNCLAEKKEVPYPSLIDYKIITR